MSTGRVEFRPTPEDLRDRPTTAVLSPDENVDEEARQLAHDLGVEFRLERKLVTPEYEYWLCTQGENAPRDGVTEQWVVGRVTQCRAGSGATVGTYGADDVPRLRRRDYLEHLGDENVRLKELYRRQPSPELENELAAVQAEIRQVLAATGAAPPPWAPE